MCIRDSPKTLMVPEGRTPLILSLDDCSYYLYMDGDGFADRLIVAEDGRVRNEYTDAEGTTHVGAFDVVPRLDEFLAEHPDFSLNGARGVLAMTGYDGVELVHRDHEVQVAAGLVVAVEGARRVHHQGVEEQVRHPGHVRPGHRVAGGRRSSGGGGCLLYTSPSPRD